MKKLDLFKQWTCHRKIFWLDPGQIKLVNALGLTWFLCGNVSQISVIYDDPSVEFSAKDAHLSQEQGAGEGDGRTKG